MIKRTIDKKEFINDLKAIPTPYVDIIFSTNTTQVLIKQPKSEKHIIHIAKN